jgi:hypothetical protein
VFHTIILDKHIKVDLLMGNFQLILTIFFEMAKKPLLAHTFGVCVFWVSYHPIMEVGKSNTNHDWQWKQ